MCLARSKHNNNNSLSNLCPLSLACVQQHFLRTHLLPLGNILPFFLPPIFLPPSLQHLFFARRRRLGRRRRACSHSEYPSHTPRRRLQPRRRAAAAAAASQSLISYFSFPCRRGRRRKVMHIRSSSIGGGEKEDGRKKKSGGREGGKVQFSPFSLVRRPETFAPGRKNPLSSVLLHPPFSPIPLVTLHLFTPLTLSFSPRSEGREDLFLFFVPRACAVTSPPLSPWHQFLLLCASQTQFSSFSSSVSGISRPLVARSVLNYQRNETNIPLQENNSDRKKTELWKKFS